MCLYTGRHLLSFLDNHDVSRIATVLTDKAMLRPAYGLLFGMPGVPAVYYGSEWGLEGDKKNGDATLRPAIEKPQENELTEWISCLGQSPRRKPRPALGQLPQCDGAAPPAVLNAVWMASACWWPSTRQGRPTTRISTPAAALRWI